MTFQTRITVRPDVRFQPRSFEDLLQHHVHIPGLDSSWTHTLIGVDVAEDGSSAELTLVSEPIAAMSMTRHLRIVGTPPARVRLVDADGNQLADAALSAPLHDGQEVEVGGHHYQVRSSSWPGRHPESGLCHDDIDWQVAVVHPAPRPDIVPTAVS